MRIDGKIQIYKTCSSLVLPYVIETISDTAETRRIINVVLL